MPPPMNEIRNRAVLHSVLLQTLQRYPNGIDLHDAYAEIDRSFSFPEDWYRQIPAGTGHDELNDYGIRDWRTLPQERLIELVKTEPQWQNEIRWARNDLRKEKLLDTTAPRGIWRLTSAGNASAAKSLDTLTTAEKEIATPKPRSETPKRRMAPPLVELGATLREGLEHKLSVLTSSMPIDDLELLVEIARTIRLRSLSTDS